MTQARRQSHRTAIWLLLCLAASTGLGQQSVRFTISPDTVLTDERFQIALEGLPPGQSVTIKVEGNHGVWRSSAELRSDERGRVELADPMRLVWSATGTRPGPGALDPSWVFTAEIGGQVIASRTITRRAVAAGVRVEPVRERGLVGTAYYPPGAGPHPAMIVLPGSQGGLPVPANQFHPEETRVSGA